jgi:putative ABC transport system permease protein
VKPGNIWHLYRVRLRARRLQEGFAVLGIAAGVALLFSSQVAGSSLTSSVAQLSRGIVGNATLQLLARDPHGFSAEMLARVRRIQGVRAAAPLLEASTEARGPRGRESVELVGADASLSHLGGTLVRHTKLQPFGGIGAVVLPAPLARTIGVTKFGQEVTFAVAGRTVTAPLYAQLGARQIGPLIASPIAIAPLSFAQEMTGLSGRVTRILVEVSPGNAAEARAALARLAAGRLNVEPASYDEALFAKAAAASSESTTLFAVISALVGFLFAFNAMLLAVPEQRQMIVGLRREGYPPRTVIAVLLFDATLLGLAACALGLLFGDELSIHLFRSAPGYLSSAFAVGSQRVVSARSVALAIGGGMAAAMIAVLSPLRDIRSQNPLAALAPRERSRTRWGAGVQPALAGALCLGAATAVLLWAPAAAIAGMALLVAALLLVLPAALAATLGFVRRVAPRFVSAVPHVAVMELGAAGARAIAITATGAIAVFASVAIQGAHGDLLGGLEDAAHDMNAFTDVWVSPAGSFNLLESTPFSPVQQRQLMRLPGVRAVRVYRGGFLDLGQRRVWVIAPPREALPLLPSSQIVEGDVRRADSLVRAGGWVVLSRALASERHLHIGASLTLPAPVPMTVRVAALSTNIGWAPGAMIMSSDDFARMSGSQDASAYNILLVPGVPVSQAVTQIRRELGAGSGLAVESAQQHADRQRTLSRQGLMRLSQIAILIMLGAVLATAAAMGTLVWQRRPRLAKLRLEGYERAELWSTVIFESVLLLGVGCATGALFGLYGQQLLDRALANVVNFPVVHSVAAPAALTSGAFVLATAAAAIALPGYLAAGVSPAVALQD